MSSQLALSPDTPYDPEDRIAELERELSSLKQALESARVIGAAVGVVMQMYDLTRDRAFSYLVRLSQDNNVKVVRLAEQVIEAAEFSGRMARSGTLHSV